MKRILLVSLVIFSLLSSGCHWMGFRTVSGNGIVKTENRSVAGFSEVSVGGPFEVEIKPGENFSVRIETDENLFRYINFDKDGRRLKIKVRDGMV
jgi:hypothetical protein